MDEIIERQVLGMSDTVAFLTARYKRDMDGARQVVEAETDDGPCLLLGVTDYALALTRMLAEMSGTTVETVLQTFGMMTQTIAPGLLKILMEGE